MTRCSRITSALFLLTLLAACGEDEVVRDEIVRPVRAMQIQAGEAFQERWFPGRAQATQEINLAFEVSGQLIERPASVGDEVEEGEVLARLDPRDYQNQLDAAVAARDRSKANYDRMLQAAKNGAVSEQDVDDAEATFEGTDARVRIAAKALDDTVIRARFPGTVAATYVENFQTVQAKQAILRVLDTSSIEMWVNIPESLISFAPSVRDIRVIFDAFPEHEVAARITEISNEASLTTRTFPVKLLMDQPDAIKILPGMAGRAAGHVEAVGEVAQGAVEIPISALGTSDNASSFVWLIDEASGTVSSRPVEVGRATPRGVLVQGLSAGDWIATAGASTLLEGQKVRLLASDEPGTG